MIDNKSIRLAVVLGGLYILAGVIIFPSWWFDILQEGGISYLIYVAQSTFLILNIIALVVISLIVFTVASLEKNHKDLYESLQNRIKGKAFLLIIWTIVFIAIFRLLSVPILAKNEDILTLAEKVQVLEQKNKSNLAISTPIETIYINTDKVEDIYSQISPKLQLSERNIGQKQGSSAEGEVGVDGVASIAGKSEDSQEKQDKYKTRNLSVSEKLVSTINYLNDDRGLVKVLPITVESKELARIDDAVRTLEAYKIEVDAEKVESTKKQITNKAFQSKVSETYSVNSWILISGPVVISKAEDNNYISIKFEYVPGENSGVNFVCEIPSTKVSKTELELLLNESSWELNIFGKIIHKKDGDSIKYSVNCLSLYR